MRRCAPTAGGGAAAASACSGLGPAATLVMLGCFAALILVAAFSLQALLYVAPPGVLAGAAGLIRVGGVPLAQLAVQRLRWWRGTRAGHTSYRAEVVQRHTGVLQLPGTLAATELLSAEDGRGGRYGLVRDRHTGYLTATLRVAPVSTWLADPADADRWVANWAAWLASLGYLPSLRWVTVTVDTAPDPGSTLTGQVAAAIDTSAPRAALEILDQLVATAPAAAADVDTRVSITFDPAAFPAQPRDIAEAVTETGQMLSGLESALGACGVSVLGRARAVRHRRDRADRVRPGGARARSTGCSPPAISPGLGGTAELGQRRPGRRGGTLGLLPARQRHLGDLGVAGSAPAERHLRRAGPPPRARAPTPSGSPSSTGRCPPPRPPRTLDNEVRAAEFRHEYSRRTRRDVTARDAHDHARARQAADEEARGAGVSLLGLYVTVTVTDPAQLPRAVADTEAAADASKIRLQRLYRSQAAGFTATLPCGICLPELARRFRH